MIRQITVTVMLACACMAQAAGQPKFPLFAESEAKFFLKVVDAEVEFIRGAKGEITHLILHQGGRDAKAVRR